jgi:hypothetical protein
MGLQAMTTSNLSADAGVFVNLNHFQARGRVLDTLGVGADSRIQPRTFRATMRERSRSVGTKVATSCVAAA